MSKKFFYIATVHLLIEADAESRAADAVSGSLDNLMDVGEILDWGYVSPDTFQDPDNDANLKDAGLIDTKEYSEGDFYKLLNKNKP